jgi:hypothetical protein
MVEHTRGPWRIETVNTQVGHCHKIMPIGACLYVDNQTLPRDSVNADSQIALANARLIAASPMLLEACRMAYRVMSQLGGNDDYEIRTRNDLIAAIDAATGK